LLVERLIWGGRWIPEKRQGSQKMVRVMVEVIH
jgi:hypothetical protein